MDDTINDEDFNDIQRVVIPIAVEKEIFILHDKLIETIDPIEVETVEYNETKISISQHTINNTTNDTICNKKYINNHMGNTTV